MNKQKSAGMTGKGFYAVLSLSVAMVGAACWYAYTHSGRTVPPRTVSSRTEEMLGTEAGTADSTLTAPAQTESAVWTAQSIPVTSEPDQAEEAAAILRPKTTVTTTSAETAATTAPVEQPIEPVAGSIVQPFSCGELVKSGTTGIWQTHNGTDYAVPLGTEVVCVLDGTVSEIRRDALWGVCVTVLHEDGTETRYCGLNDGLAVMAGQILERGTVIGAVGGTAEAESLTEPHLHFEVRQNGQYVDPEAFLHSDGTQPAEN
ncbi:MAG: M23 family metallopeptidase [Oscillospiraceae bacterium]|nr:M23 family metallopeptidase [Oscillospiraceae bacterium]